MTPETFRKLALQLPGAEESEHLGHADFRVGGKVFATLGYPSVEFAAIMLAPQQQQSFVRADPNVFLPVPGGWGRRGSTNVRLRPAEQKAVRKALLAAWMRKAPKRLVAAAGGAL
jgi:hypothetical protein